MMKKIYTALGLHHWLMILFLSTFLYSWAQDNNAQPQNLKYRLSDLKVDYLPNINIARLGHATLCLDGELVIFGGHTNGFVPTATAEYLRDGAWHTVPLAYSHDHGTVIKLRSGKVFLAGGHKEDLGIGQQFSAEIYDPVTHTSQGFGCMDRKRAYANAIEMKDGQVVIAGNWYADDAIEMFEDIYDPYHTNATGIKEVSTTRARPYILRISDDDAIIFSATGDKGNHIDSGIIDRLKGPSYHEPFLEKWHPMGAPNIHRSYSQFIGDEAPGRYEWLLPVENEQTGQVAIARVKGATDGGNPIFSLLQIVPTNIKGKKITYSSLVCDPKRKLAYLIGEDDKARIYVVAISYANPEQSPMTVYITAPQQIAAQSTSPTLTAEGDLVFTGGCRYNNFTPSNVAIRLPLGGNREVAANNATIQHNSNRPALLLWIGIPCILVCIIAVICIVWYRRRKKSMPPMPMSKSDVATDDTNKPLPKDEIMADLFKRIERLMDEEQLYLNPNLKAPYVAVRVGSNTAYVSAAINTQQGCSFSQFLSSYRIAYAQNLMRLKPESKISTISTLSGFSTDSTFFRAFRSVTGMSPKEWLTGIGENNNTRP